MSGSKRFRYCGSLAIVWAGWILAFAVRLAGEEGLPAACVTTPVSYVGYWFAIAPSARPIDRVPLILGGTVRGETVGEETYALVEGQQIEGRWHKIHFTIDHVMKGTAQEGETITATHFVPDSSGSPSAGPRESRRCFDKGTRCLLWLRPEPEQATYRIVGTADHGPPPLRLAAKVPSDESGPLPIAHLFAELSTTVRSDEPELSVPALYPLGYLASYLGHAQSRELLVTLAENPNAEIAVPALLGLSRGPKRDRSSLPFLQELSHKRNDPIHGHAIAARLLLGDASALADALHWDQTGSAEHEQGSLLFYEIAAAINSGWGRHDAAAISGLEKLLDARTPQFRHGAIEALREMANRDLIPTFIACLDRPDRTVQYHAIMGLYQAAGDGNNTLTRGLAPAHDRFMERPLFYVTQWKLWWEEGAKFEADPMAEVASADE